MVKIRIRNQRKEGFCPSRKEADPIKFLLANKKRINKKIKINLSRKIKGKFF